MIIKMRRKVLLIGSTSLIGQAIAMGLGDNYHTIPKSDYGSFKRDCETMLEKQLGSQLTIF